jgi:hypothetical protein
MAVRGEIERVGTPAHDAGWALERLLDEEEVRLSLAWPGPAPHLRSVYPPLTWRRKRRIVLDLAERYLSGAIPTVTMGSAGEGRSAKDLPNGSNWSEVRIEVPELRLAGRADLVQRQTGKVVIRDLKTGRVLTDDGEILPHIERQMRLYGLMARRVWPEAKVQLVVDYGSEHQVSFGSTEEDEIAGWLDGLLIRLPTEATVAAEPIATPGKACEGCPYRHFCPAYRAAAPEFWRVAAPVRMPLDTWGEIAKITSGRNAQSDVSLTDAAGRMVKVFGLLQARLETLATGDRLWLFGLRTGERRGGPERWRHPWNFFETADDDPYARAWALQTFTEA